MKNTAALIFVLCVGGGNAMGAPPVARVGTDRSYLQLGEEAERWLTVRFAEASGPPVVTTNAGSIDAVEQVGPGEYRAHFVAPTESYPQIAIIAAVFYEPTGPVHGWLVLPLWGQGKAVARTRPRAVVTVTVGEMTFGPERANSRGVARVPVRVPPGVNEAHDGTKPIPLNLPQITHHHLVIGTRDLAADQIAEATVRIYVVTPTGQPRAGAKVKLSAERGTLGPVTKVGTGTYEARWRLEPRAVGTEKVSAALVDQPEQVQVAAVVSLSGKAATVELHSEPAVRQAGDSSPVRVTATVLDAGGNRVTGDLEWKSDFGRLEAPTPVEGGAYEGVLEVPDKFEGRASLSIVAHLRDRPSVRGEHQLPLEPAEPVRLESQPAGRVVADGRHWVSLSMRLEDQFGNAVSQLTPQITATTGEIQRIASDGDLVRYEYLPPHHIRPSSTTLAISAGQASAQVDLSLTPTLATLVAGAKVGTLIGAGDVGPMIGAELSYWTMLAREHVGARIELGYQRLDEKSGGAITANSTDVGWTVLAQAGWRRSPWRDLVLSAGLGVGMTRMVSRIRVSGEPEQEGVDSLGFALVSGGPGWRLGPGTAFVELSYRWHQPVETDFLTGSLGALLVNGGYRLDVF